MLITNLSTNAQRLFSISRGRQVIVLREINQTEAAKVKHLTMSVETHTTVARDLFCEIGRLKAGMGPRSGGTTEMPVSVDSVVPQPAPT